VVSSLQGIGRECGLQVDKEVYVGRPAWLGRRGQWARLDLRLAGAPRAPDEYVDVSLVNAASHGAAEADCGAAGKVEEQKWARYPAAGSHAAATPFVVELGGRLGPAARDLLRRLLRLKIERDASLRWGGFWAAHAISRRWLGVLAASVQRGVARAVLDSAGAAGGTPNGAKRAAAAAAGCAEDLY